MSGPLEGGGGGGESSLIASAEAHLHCGTPNFSCHTKWCVVFLVFWCYVLSRTYNFPPNCSCVLFVFVFSKKKKKKKLTDSWQIYSSLQDIHGSIALTFVAVTTSKRQLLLTEGLSVAAESFVACFNIYLCGCTSERCDFWLKARCF